MPQATYNKLLNTIDDGIDTFLAKLPEVERDTYNRLLVLIKELELKDGNIQNNLRNIKLISVIKQEMEKMVLSESYLEGVTELVDVYDAIEELQNSYFAELSDKFKPKPVYAELKKLAIEDTVSLLTENGVGSAVSDEINSMITDYITTGGSYADMHDAIKEALIGIEDKPGALSRYSKQVTTDALNQYNGTVTKAMTDDLGLEWFMYVGSNIDTTRPFCKAMTDLKYYHKSEIPSILNGNINGKKVSLAGLYEDTTPENFQRLRGGYQCRHSIFPVSYAVVPESVKARVS